MTGTATSAQGWRRTARILVLVCAGTVGFAGRWYLLPRWVVFLAAMTVPAVWIVTGFQSIKSGETEAHRRQRMRNIAIGLALFALVALFYAATVVRVGT